ncbi:MAG: sigma-70 family RNA polymerase sigma factor [Prevotella sp.]|nr:sigma-70 family RNA polymerase sigma factor [Prevotella sp.]
MDDKELVEHILRRGETDCFNLLMKRYMGQVFSRVIGIVRQEELAKDIAQQTFIRAFTRLASWHGSSFGAWVNTIAVHLSLNELERMRRHPVERLEDKCVKDAPSRCSDNREALLQRMDKAISQLPEKDQRIIRLYYYEGRKAGEIAQLLAMSPSNVLVRLHRIREQLKKRIESNERDE